MKYYDLESCEKLIDSYIEKGGESITLEEGCLGLGLIVCYGYNLKTTVIKEVPINEWSSAHTIRMYNTMPKKYEDMIEKCYQNN